MFNPELRAGKLIGYSLETPYAFFFFGTRYFPRAEHTQVFPQFRFAYLRQVHGSTFVPGVPDGAAEADAHYTREKNLALVSQTADCIPILLANEHVACAIHSGWRGTALNIAGGAAHVFAESPPRIGAIGPHILMSSFEVGEDVATKLESAPQGRGLSRPHLAESKRHFDLTEMVRRQLRTAFGSSFPLAELLEDTMTNPLFCSFRREKQQADRQFSFVVLKP